MIGNWYVKEGSDESLIRSAVIMARVTGSTGATEGVLGRDGIIERSATVYREGFQEPGSVLIDWSILS